MKNFKLVDFVGFDGNIHQTLIDYDDIDYILDNEDVSRSNVKSYVYTKNSGFIWSTLSCKEWNKLLSHEDDIKNISRTVNLG